ncbi:MAG: S-methyl-5-thioribose-1-phosphate isomerase [Anaerovoracaceae bacterium]|nr:S-methyl-5-thioribose-1-phosphate isomerase [Anaerovoracaceae bacterium]
MGDINRITHVENVKLREDGRAVVIIDQSLLPGRTEYIQLDSPEKMYDAIFHLKVRGAPAIGICAAYCMAVLARSEAAPRAIRGCCGTGVADEVFLENMKRHGEYLKSSRPTAVNLAWAVDRVMMAARVEMIKARRDDIRANAGYDRMAEAIRREAVAIHEEDIAMCLAISEYGLELVKDGDGILTHCNAGPLATSGYGTALGPILLGTERGMSFKVFADETRPLLQGARLTTYELHEAGVDVTLICDNMASMVMKNGWVQACFVGCDRLAANGDTANKIGTSSVAILAKHYNIPFYVLGPTSTIDMSCPDGSSIPIELRDPSEIREKFYREPMALQGVKCYNPAFDVTDHELITAIVTEKGICRPPFDESLRNVTGK